MVCCPCVGIYELKTTVDYIEDKEEENKDLRNISKF